MAQSLSIISEFSNFRVAIPFRACLQMPQKTMLVWKLIGKREFFKKKTHFLDLIGGPLGGGLKY